MPRNTYYKPIPGPQGPIGPEGPAGSGAEIHGSQSEPILINPSTGLVPTIELDQVWYIAPSTGTGSVALSQISVENAVVGQSLTLFGPGESASAWFTLADGGETNTDQNGDWTLDYDQALVYEYNGTNWYLVSNRV